MLHFQKSQPSNLDDIAVLHRACFTESLSRELGTGYARKTLQWFLTDANRFLWHVENEGKIVGYVGGFISQYPGDGSTSGMLRYAMREAVTGVAKKPWLIFNKQIRQMYPIIFKNIYRKIIPKTKVITTIKKYTNDETKAGLVVIGVHPQFRGKGIFEMLMTAFENETVERNIQRMGLSVRKTNQHAIHAYEKCGWQVSIEHADSFEMFKEIS
ncbi:MAG: GNAT family N-acetyltransferase [Chitinophagaceae bacterium]